MVFLSRSPSPVPPTLLEIEGPRASFLCSYSDDEAKGGRTSRMALQIGNVLPWGFTAGVDVDWLGGE